MPAAQRGTMHTAARRLLSYLPGPLVRLLKAILTVARRLRNPTPAEGGITDHLVARFCTGHGVEVGPGHRPYGPPGRTLLVDRFDTFKGTRLRIGLLADAGALPLADNSADFLIASHVLEHTPDPLTVLAEWRRILRNDAALVLILPHGQRTWDRGRSLSTLADLQRVHRQPANPENPVNWEEFERISMGAHDHFWINDPHARHDDGTWDRRWIADRGLIHYHVWTQHEMAEILAAVGYRLAVVIDELPDRRDSFMVIAARGASGC